MTSRRNAFKAVLAGTLSTQVPAIAARPATRFASGAEGQRRADRGDGTYVNPIVPGDHADPTVLRDGDDYYMTFSSFFSYPGVILWHSTDLVNWVPIGPALTQPLGTVWAMDLVKHDGRYFIYIPANPGDRQSIFVIHADDIRGPWSDPIDLKIEGCIDPGHAVGEDGKRYLFFNGVRRIRLADDGLSTVGALEHVYDPWRYPEDWVVEMFAAEGPKIFRRGAWFYLMAAVGGTSGPATSHMVIVARSASIHGPWKDCPHNPIVHTRSADEPWWSRGHASAVVGPAGDWWMVYHGYENGFRTLGRQTLLEPMAWTADGWPRAMGGTLSAPLRKPVAKSQGPAGVALSDDFSHDRFGTQWTFFNPDAADTARVQREPQALRLAAKGTGPADSSPLTMLVGDRRYEAEITIDVEDDAQAGLTLFYSERMFCGIAFTRTQMLTYQYGQEQRWMRQDMASTTVRIKVSHIDHVVTFHYAQGDGAWIKHPWQVETSGMHHNVFGGFLSLKIALHCAGAGHARLRHFVYRGLPT
ncbi:MAG: family 43 glycosylhydrolase [Betaproteobacteria bacterium]